jgi:hypothetical protein
MFSRIVGPPLAQGFGGQTFLADVPIRRKTTNRQHLNFTGNGVFSQATEKALWINNYNIFIYLGKAVGDYFRAALIGSDLALE